MSKTGLVLEGGGMRGAYTAGCLSWMIDNNITVDYGIGISAGAVCISSYFMNNKDSLYEIMINYMSDKKNVGVIPLLKEGRYVGYDYMFDDLLPNIVHYDISSLKTMGKKFEIGLYDLNQCKTIYFNNEEMDMKMIKASCTLPIAGRIVDYGKYRFLDGGITVMVPIERSIEMGCDKNLVIITKPEGYIRKAAGAFMRWFMKFNYPKYPQLVYDYTNRHINYNRQMGIVKDEEEKGNCVLIRPSVTIPVKRFSGDPENLKKLYELGYKDMEDKKEAILKLLG